MRSLPLLAVAALCACSYQAENPQIFVQVDGIPQGANRLEVQLTDSAALTRPYAPTFGQGTLTSLQLALDAPKNPGTFTITADAFDPQQVKIASGSSEGALPGAGTLQITLAGLPGVYGAACDMTSSTPCAAPNQCEQYVPSDPLSGICTIAPCNADTDCPVTSPAATCVVFPGGTSKACQFDCTSGGQSSCPGNLFCHAVPGTGGKSFCQGD